MIRRATERDIPALTAFFDKRIETSMFLLSNLEAHGIGNTTHRHGTTYHLAEGGGSLTGALGCTNSGLLMCQLPGLTAQTLPPWLGVLQGQQINGMTGAADQVGLVVEGLGVSGADWQINEDQPLFSLATQDLEPGDTVIRPVTDADTPLLRRWIPRHLADTGLASEPVPPAMVQDRIAAILASGTYVLLIEDGTPVALTGLNAQAGSAVQIGGVFVPPELRGAGRAGRALAAHLVALRDQGVTRAILFAANPAAARAYRKIGFDRIGTYRVALLSHPHVIAGAA